jgi:SnoaL-like polyketide cyclase
MSVGQAISVGAKKTPSMSHAPRAPSSDWTPKDVVREFFVRLDAHDNDGLVQLLGPSSTIDIGPAKITGNGPEVAKKFFGELLRAFPDLRIIVRSLMGNDHHSVAEITIQGTQAADFLGVHNQEKFIDHEQAWLFQVDHGVIAAVRAYWCQNALYRRLAVKRLDQISIAG